MQKKHIGKQSIKFEEAPYIVSAASVVGAKEGRGPLRTYFDEIISDSMFGANSWEEAEGKFQKKAMELALKKANLTANTIDYMVAGDLQSQLTATTFGGIQFQIPLFGVYGACSTAGEGISLASVLVNSGCAEYVLVVTSSHTEVAERQFRFPISYGNQKPLSATWTVTGSGAFILTNEKNKQDSIVKIRGITTGVVQDYGVKDSMNMGACMAPAACNVIENHLKDFKSNVEEYDQIITGDLGKVGKRILMDMLRAKNIDNEQRYMDCGMEIYEDKDQDTHAGGSGCGCSASVLAGYILEQFKQKKWKRVLFLPTGALLSKISFNEGRTVPSIAHGILLERED